ncbi:MAG TPA: ankyrin repeat domain-containing protein [Methylomirabilota bacterium]|nr:ankyrin repeat domain-containing protein [Methylomirabilota bacterium]
MFPVIAQVGLQASAAALILGFFIALFLAFLALGAGAGIVAGLVGRWRGSPRPNRFAFWTGTICWTAGLLLLVWVFGVSGLPSSFMLSLSPVLGLLGLAALWAGRARGRSLLVFLAITLAATGTAGAEWHRRIRHRELTHAAWQGDAERVKRFLQEGYSPDTRDLYDYTLLMLAVRSRDRRTVETLLGAGANVNAVGPHGWTALRAAVMEAEPELVERLLAAGADVHLRGPSDDRLSELARGRGRPDVAAIIEKAESAR